VINDRKKCVEWVTDTLKNKLNLKTKIVGCKESGTVIVVSLENEEEKKKVMKNKCKLKAESIYIKNDLSWKERNVQVRINK